MDGACGRVSELEGTALVADELCEDEASCSTSLPDDVVGVNWDTVMESSCARELARVAV